MMRTKRFIVGVGTAVAFTLSWSPVYAQQSTSQINQAMVVSTFGLLSPKLLKTLNLTPEQAAKIQVSINAFKEAQKAYVSEVAPLRKEVTDKLFGPNPVKEADVARPITKIADLREKILREGFKIALEVRNVLTPEQLSRAEAIRQQVQEIQSEIRNLYNDGQ
jgi:Spy/CpxP family protein refolding chaperone